MDEKTDELIALVAKNHGISLDKTDPIMVVPTLLRYVMDESQAKQQEMLDEFKSELQSAQLQWDYAAKDKADRILNAALKANTAAMEQVLITGAKQTAEIIRKEVEDSLKKSRSQVNNARRVVFWNLAASVITLLAAAIACVAAFLR